MRASVRKNKVEWAAIEKSAYILTYTLEHFLASADIPGRSRA